MYARGGFGTYMYDISDLGMSHGKMVNKPSLALRVTINLFTAKTCGVSCELIKRV